MKIGLTILFTIIAGWAQAQYQLNNDASQTGSNPDCFQVTSSQSGKTGQVWNNSLFDLNEKFEIYATVNFGNDPAAGKGMSFSFHQGGLLAGVPSPGNMGFTGISPSLVVELDAAQDASDTDPPFDHGALMQNGSVNHGTGNNLAGPNALISPSATVKDGSDHMLHILWEPDVNRFRAWFNCNLIVDHTENIINTVFGSDPMVYWGFTAGTGSNGNPHTVCIDYRSFDPPTMFDTTDCQGQQIVSNAGYGYEYAWSPSAGLVDDSAQFAIASPTNTTHYTVSIFDSCGYYRTDEYTHNIIDSNIAVLSGDIVTCAGIPVPLDIDVEGSPPFTVNIFDGSGTTQYDLDSNGHDTTTGQPIMVSPTATTTYTISAFNGSNNCGAAHSGSATVTLDILDGLQSNTNDATCHGRCNGSAQFNIPHATGNYTYIWPDQTGGTSKTSLCADNYEIAVDNGDGCKDTISLTVNEPDKIEIAPLPDITVCANETISVTANASGGSGNYVYNWSTQESTQSIDVSAPSTTTFSVTVTDDNNCPAATESFELNVLPLLELEVSNDTGFCIGGEAELRAYATGGDGNYSFEWNDAGSTTDPTLTESPTSSTDYVVTLTDGCGSDPQIDTVSVKVDHYPEHSYEYDQPACSEELTQFTINDYDTNATYTMYFSRGIDPEESAAERFQKSLSETGCYDVTLETETQYCDSIRYDSCAVFINETPQAQFSYTPEEPSRLSDFEAVFINETRSDFEEAEWLLDGDIIGFEDSVNHVFPDSGTYEIKLTILNAAGCSDTASDIINVRGEVGDLYVPNVFSPNNDGLNDVFIPVIRDRNISGYEFVIYNRWGQEVFKTNDRDEGWDGSVNNTNGDKQQEIYVWKVKYTDFNGDPVDEDGTVLLFK